MFVTLEGLRKFMKTIEHDKVLLDILKPIYEDLEKREGDSKPLGDLDFEKSPGPPIVE